ncbi:hypothetical protein FJ656_07225, partial [Schumannella luteola]
GLVLLGAPLLAAVVSARLVSASANFALNRRFVFRARAGSLGGQAVRYAALAAVVLAVNYLVLAAMTDAGAPLLAAKVAVEVALFAASFGIQRMLVFARRASRAPAAPAPAPPRVRAGRRVAGAAAAGASVLLLAGCSVAAGAGSSGSDSAGSDSAEAATGDAWRDTSLVHDIRVEDDDTVLEDLVATFLASGEKDWGSVTVTIDGTTLDDVGIKLKGNSSLRTVSAETPLAEVPWILRLDEFVDGQSYQGETELVIRGNSSETSLNEAVALGLLRASGLAAENAVAARFRVGDEQAALRLVVENPTGAWADEEFGTAGQLYKAESGGDEDYHGTDPGAYADS